MTPLWAFVIGVCAGTVVMYIVLVYVMMRESRIKCEIFEMNREAESILYKEIEEYEQDLQMANELIDHYRKAIGEENERIRGLH